MHLTSTYLFLAPEETVIDQQFIWTAWAKGSGRVRSADRKVPYALYPTRSDDLSCGQALKLPRGAPFVRRHGWSGDLHDSGAAADCEMVCGTSENACRQVEMRIFE